MLCWAVNVDGDSKVKKTVKYIYIRCNSSLIVTWLGVMTDR